MESMVTPSLLKTVYQHKKVFITGHSGFKGSWLWWWLHQLGAQLKGYSLAPEYADALFTITHAADVGNSVINDIRNQSQLQQEIVSFEPDFIFHLAAQPLVRHSYAYPLETFSTNVQGTANLLEAVKMLPGKCQVVIITTDKVYRNLEINYRYKEDDQLGGYDPYSASKAAAEIVTASYRSSFFNPDTYAQHGKSIAVARAGNVIGGGDRSKDRIIPDIVQALEQSKPVLVRNPLAVRPWQHVLEPLKGYLMLGALLTQDPISGSSAFNFGPDEGDELTVEAIVKTALKEWGSGSYALPQLKNQPHEAGLLQLDSTRAKQLIGWRPVLNSAEAIHLTMQWYRQAGVDPLACTLQQINDYQNRI